MQLNSHYFTDIDWEHPETNVRAGVQHIRWLMDRPGLNTWWAVAVAYNCGYNRFGNGMPNSSIDYGSRVMAKWKELDPIGYRELR